MILNKDDNKRVWWYIGWIEFVVGFVAPMIGVLPFVFALEKDGDDPSRDRAGTCRRCGLGCFAVSTLFYLFVCV